jgi:hypothetical protein
MPSPFVVEGPAVILPARIAAGLERALHLDEYRIRVRGHDRDLDEVLAAWHGSALHWAGSASEQARFRAQFPSLDDLRNLPDALTAEDVAAHVNRTQHAIRKAAREGRLTGERIAGRWQFRPEDVAAWQATRKRGAA